MSLAILAMSALAATATTASAANLAPSPTPAPAPALQGGYAAEWTAPSLYLPGQPFPVTVSATVGAGADPVAAWFLTPAAFSVNGRALGERGDAKLSFGVDTTVELSFDLGPLLGDLGSDFTLIHDGSTIDLALQVGVVQVAPEGLDFMSMPVEDLTDWNVILFTNQGTMRAEFWPDVAPNHVRNFLDLAYTGFYDGTTFHRVIPGFMIQGGDPTGTGTGNGPRQLKAEFNAKPHVRGVLSMARVQDPDSASCQFFVMHATASHLDGKYSGFGMLLDGFETLDAIVNTPRNRSDQPNTKQIIERAVVVPAKAAPEGDN